MFDQSTAVAVLGALALVWATYRTSTAKYWRDTAEAREQRIKTLEEALDRKSDEKHEALGELAAQRLKTDLTPVLQGLAEVQRGLTDAVERVTVRLDEIDRRLNDG